MKAHGICMVAVLVTVCALVYISVMHCSSSTFKKFMKWSERKVAIKIMDIFQMSDIHNNRCILKNSYLKNQRIVMDECEMCENIDMFVVYNITEESNIISEINQDIHNEVPIVVQSHLNQPDQDDLLVSDIVAQIGYLKSVYVYKQCQYQSNFKARFSELPHLMNYIASGGKIPFYAFWENCANQAIKEFRVFYQRPSFLGGHVQLTGSNWMYMCRDFTGKIYRQVELFSPVVMVMVQAGEVAVKLKAAEECVEMCDGLERTLINGDTLIFSSNIYSLFYKPVCNNSETIVVGVGGYMY